MAANKKSFVLYCDSKALINKLSDENAGKLIKHIFSYVTDENPETDNPFVDLAFEHFKQHLKKDLKKWDEKSAERVDRARKAGLASAEKRKQLKATKSNSLVKNELKPTVNGNGNVNDNDIKTTSLREIEVIFEELKIQIKKGEHDAYLENLQMKLKLKSRNAFNKLLPEFKQHLIITEKIHKTVKDLLKHFYNYLLTLEQKGKLNGYKKPEFRIA